MVHRCAHVEPRTLLLALHCPPGSCTTLTLVAASRPTWTSRLQPKSGPAIVTATAAGVAFLGHRPSVDARSLGAGPRGEGGAPGAGLGSGAGGSPPLNVAATGSRLLRLPFRRRR